MVDRDIIFVSNALANGGAGRVLCLLANRFAARGYRVGVLAFHRHDREFALDDMVVKSYGPPGNGPREKLKRMRWIREFVGINPQAAIVAFEYFVNIQTLIACFGLGNRVIVSERNDPERVGSGFPVDITRKVLYLKAQRLVCQTNDAAQYFSDSIKKTVILNPINPDLPLPFNGKRRNTIVTFSRLEPQKNLQMLINAFGVFLKRNRDYTLEIYGDGSERDRLLALVNSLSLEDSVNIRPTRLDIHNAIRDCAMFVLPSDYEGLSNSMLEAMALGLPTLCTDCPCGGARMVINHEHNGLLIPVGDTEALAEAMGRVADDPELAMRLGQHAEEIRDSLSVEAIVNQWDKVLFGDSLAT